MHQPHAHAQYSAAELAWLHTLDGYADPEPSRAERLQRRKVKNRGSAKSSRERRKARQSILEARVRELELGNADLLAQVQLETAALKLASTLPITAASGGVCGDAPRPARPA
jgi:hypothetical protein